MALIAYAFGQPLVVGIVAGMALAMSSDAIGLALLQEKNLLPTPGGQASFAVLLFQDLAVIPLLLALPFIGGEAETFHWSAAAKAVAFVVALIAAGRLLVRSPKASTATSSSSTSIRSRACCSACFSWPSACRSILGSSRACRT